MYQHSHKSMIHRISSDESMAKTNTVTRRRRRGPAGVNQYVSKGSTSLPFATANRTLCILVALPLALVLLAGPALGASGRRTQPAFATLHGSRSSAAASRRRQQQQESSTHQFPPSRASPLKLRESSPSSSSSSSNGKLKTVNPPPAEFECQEMKIQLNALARAGITSPKSVNPINRNEILSHAKQVLAKDRPSLVAHSQLSTFLPSTRWRLAISTDDAVLQGLPGDANVYLHFLDGATLDYVLEFGPQTLGLDKIAAHSDYSVDPANGVVTYSYESITCDVGPFKQVGVGLFGMLMGRTSSIRASFVDGKVWIERDVRPTGDEVYNVYVREDAG